MRNLIVLGVVGLIAQLIDGSLGMAYGVTSSTLLLAAGIAPAAASAAVHFSEIGTTLVGGFAHHKLGNVDWRTVSIIAVPGGIGAFIGATFLSNLPADAATPWVAALLMALGIYVIWRFLALGGRRPHYQGRLHAGFLAPLGVVAGLMDAIGGGGWGPVGTTSLLSSGRLEPRKVIGSIDTSEFVVSVGGSLGFLFALGGQGINFAYAGALLVGGVIAAPFAAWLVRVLPGRILGIAAGGIIVLTNTGTIVESLGGSVTLTTSVLVSVFIGWVAILVRVIRQHRRSMADVDAASDADAAADADAASAKESPVG